MSAPSNGGNLLSHQPVAPTLNWDLLIGLRLDASQSERHKATVYFEELRARPDGWLVCARLLLESSSVGQRLSDIDDNVKYFCLQIIEHYLRNGYKCNSGAEQHAQVRQFLSGWSGNFINGNAEEKTFVRNKVAQLYSLAFVVDYPQRWPTFIEDLAATLAYGERAVDLFLRILHTIDGDVVDREIPHTAEENARNAAIKDRLRETCFLPPSSGILAYSGDGPQPTQLADVWYWILTSGRLRSDLVCLCLDVVALYASWIDIGLLANQRYASVFLELMRQPQCRESVCACLTALVAKGMPAEAKVELVESYAQLLRGAGLMEPSDNETGDYLASLGKLIGALGLQLVRCYVKLYPGQQQQQQQQQLEVEDQQRQRLIGCIEAKLPLAIRLLGNEDDDVSHSVLDFCQEYVGLLKSLRCVGGGGSGLSSVSQTDSNPSESNWVRQLLGTVIAKLQLDESYDAESPGEEEAMFDEYRRDLKILFGNLVALDGQLVLSTCSQFVAHLLPNWQSAGPARTEVAIYLLHLLGEFLPPSKSGDHFVSGSSNSSGGGGGGGGGSSHQSALFNDMLVSLVTSQVSRCAHPLVSLRYFETVVRYEKFFLHNAQFVPEVLMSFLDERGLQSANLMVRSRVSYLLSRFVKCHKNQLRGYTEEILTKLQSLLQPRNVVMPAGTPSDNGDHVDADNDGDNPPLAPSDQMFLFESAAMLIVSSGAEPQQKRALFEALLSPLLQQVSRLVTELPRQPDEASQLAYAECAKYNIEFVSRASKAFSVGATMADNGCAEPFAQLTGAFLSALGLPDWVAGRSKICTAVRGYLHRMVICLDAGVLPYIPMAAEQLLRSPDAQDLHDFYALLGQLVPKFKAELLPFLATLLPPLMQATMTALGQLGAQPSRDPGAAGPLRKAYLAFLACLCANQLAAAILCQPEGCLRCALDSLTGVLSASGALSDDAATCRAAIGCARGLATATNDSDWPPPTNRRQAFLAEFLLASLRAPVNSPGVDLREAQTALFINDLAGFLVALKETAPNVILQCIQPVVAAPAAQELINLIGQCEPTNHKSVAKFLKTYYQIIKSA